MEREGMYRTVYMRNIGVREQMDMDVPVRLMACYKMIQSCK